MMLPVFAAFLVGLMVWWRRTPAPVWASVVALLPIGLAAWCVVVMVAELLAEHRVPETLTAMEQVRQVALHSARGMRWGMRFWAAGLVSAGWLLFAMWRWEGS
jgi:hypothetical protein